jgi:hypothetical protein
MAMTNSAHTGRLLGPALIGITVTEWMNLDVFAAAAGPTFAAHVYLNGTLIFIAGLALVRSHHVWSRQWPVLITIVGWLAIVAGLGRMIAPVSSQNAGRNAPVLYGSLVVLLTIGVVLTYKSFRRER